MSGSGVRTLRYALEAREGTPIHIHANEMMLGDHPLEANLAALKAEGRCTLTDHDAVNVYVSSRLSGERYDFVDCDAFGTGQPHTSEAWWAVKTGGLLYLCATDSCTTAGHNPHKTTSGYAAVAKKLPACNEQGLRLLIGASFREAAARNLHARPVFAYFHPPSSSFRVMMRLFKPKRPPAAEYENLAHVGRCTRCGEIWRVPSTQLGAAASLRPCSCAQPVDVDVMGPMWVGEMHDAHLVREMAAEAEARGWDDAVELLRTMEAEAGAEGRGALLFLHLGEVQRHLAVAGLSLPPLAALVAMLRQAGFGAAPSHSEAKSLKTSATLADIEEVVRASHDGDEIGTISAQHSVHRDGTHAHDPSPPGATV
jgi:tRNA (guanine26-N2/guanine27-N2)-dimethyltransferase